MALDGLFLYSINEELKELVGCKIDKVNQPERDEIILTIREKRKNIKLLISASSNYPRIHFTNIQKQNPQKAPMFCMILRKYLNSAKILDIKQLNFDRIMDITFESSDEMGFNSKYHLIIEIMGRHSNITLVRERDNIIMDSIKHITSDINSYRNLYAGIEYISPPKSNKLNPSDFSMESFIKCINENNIGISEKLFSKAFTGVSSELSKEIFYRLNTNKHNNEYTLEDLFAFSKEFFNKFLSNNFNFSYYIDNNGLLKDFHCIDLLRLEENCIKKQYTSASLLLEDFYYKKDKIDRLKSKSSDLQKLIHTNIDRCKKKIKILKDSLEKCKSKDKFKLCGELLTANIYSLKKGDSKAKLLNYYSENEEYITINFDENKTPSENIQYYYKKYNKLKTSEEMGTVQLKSSEEELQYLSSVLSNIENVDSYDEIDDIKKELIETGYIKFRKSLKNKNKKESSPLHFVSTDNCDIYVGKNNLQNDYLTLKFARKNDIWMHTKDVHGSHVIIKNNGNITDKTLEEAASLAAYYSKGRNSSKVAVDYTEIRNVKKPSGAKPGMVIYYTNKTILAEPKILVSEETSK
ncbi:NFACT RNA binding domain-containing protein [Clostridium sp. KNHs214]|uniref:Rqc2 family fibronectin-binding protein n=1 Tax=Clostridium sp. KNHs214 TaxID=1540257 RepID=UPI000550AA18|nr:NFACT RNA binding domain-containing protein [Clostridium sp. KNHs214]